MIISNENGDARTFMVVDSNSRNQEHLVIRDSIIFKTTVTVLPNRPATMIFHTRLRTWDMKMCQFGTI